MQVRQESKQLSVVTTIAEKTSIYGTHARVGTINLVEILACFFKKYSRTPSALGSVQCLENLSNCLNCYKVWLQRQLPPSLPSLSLQPATICMILSCRFRLGGLQSFQSPDPIFSSILQLDAFSFRARGGRIAGHFFRQAPAWTQIPPSTLKSFPLLRF